VPDPDVVVVPGGFGDTELDAALVQWLRKVHETTTWTTSVCTGSIYLAAAGILDGVDATTHWTRRERLEQLGAHYVPERVVERGKVITAAGVSSGIDMALRLVEHLHGTEMAELVQLGIEYDPEPPFDAGSPTKAPPELVELARARLADTLSDEAVEAVVAQGRSAG
jgi:transcriptional regulator GlxA family with amidase domain